MPHDPARPSDDDDGDHGYGDGCDDEDDGDHNDGGEREKFARSQDATLSRFKDFKVPRIFLGTRTVPVVSKSIVDCNLGNREETCIGTCASSNFLRFDRPTFYLFFFHLNPRRYLC